MDRDAIVEVIRQMYVADANGRDESNSPATRHYWRGVSTGIERALNGLGIPWSTMVTSAQAHEWTGR